MSTPLLLSLSFLLALSSHGVAAQSSQPDAPAQGIMVSLRPSGAIVIGIFSIILSLTFLLLVYAKLCHTTADADLFDHDAEDHSQQHRPNGFLTPQSRFSGIDKAVIESLPFFRFTSLRGAKEGLECAVCLSRFEGADILRLLPKCKHAFHIDCVDRWLESHSSCPFCRCKVEIEDLMLFKYSASSRSLFSNPPFPSEEEDLELYVEREPAGDGQPPSRFAWGGSFRKTEKGKKEKKKEALLPERGDGGQFLHKHKHRIIFSDVVFKNRWSDVNSSDLISLKSEMLNLRSSNRFSAADASSERFMVRSLGQESRSSADGTFLRIKEEMERKRLLEGKASQINCSLTAPEASFPSSYSEATTNLENPSTLLNSMIASGNNRCMSEIINVSRFDDAMGRSRGTSNNSSLGKDIPKDEKMRRLWLPIARRTVQWFAGREKRSETQRARPAEPNV